MTRYTKMLGLFSIAVVAPLAFSSAANAQYRIERPQIELTPNCEVIDCSTTPVVVKPKLPTRVPYCTPLYCIRPDFEIQRPELERPVLEDSVRLEEIQNVERVRQLKYDEFRSEPILEPVSESAPPKKAGIEQYLKFDE